MPVHPAKGKAVKDCIGRGGLHVLGKFYVLPVGYIHLLCCGLERARSRGGTGILPSEPGVAGYGRTTVIDAVFPSDKEAAFGICDGCDLVGRADFRLRHIRHGKGGVLSRTGIAGEEKVRGEAGHFMACPESLVRQGGSHQIAAVPDEFPFNEAVADDKGVSVQRCIATGTGNGRQWEQGKCSNEKNGSFPISFPDDFPGKKGSDILTDNHVVQLIVVHKAIGVRSTLIQT